MPLRRTGGRPLTEQVYIALSRSVAEGKWPDRLPSERALADDLGVCRVTVARAVNRLVEEGILLRRRGSGTYVAPRREELRPVSGSVALIVPYSRDVYTSHIVTGVSQTLTDAGLHVLFHDTLGDPRREATFLTRMRRHADAFLTLPVNPTRNERPYRELTDAGIPVVLVDRYFPTLDTDWVVTDNFRAAFEAVTRLLEEGRRRVVHITTAEYYLTSTMDRRMGFHQALLNAGHPMRPDDVRIAVPAADGEPYAPEILNAPPLDVVPLIRSLMREPEPPDAIFAANDWTTLAVLNALLHDGYRVPDDVALAGFIDNDVVASHLPVPILAVSQQKDAMGRRAAEIVLSRLRDGAGPPEHVFLPASMRMAGGAWAGASQEHMRSER